MSLKLFLIEVFKKIDYSVQKNKLDNGVNGPYKDNETNVRKYAHLLVLYSNVIKSNLFSNSEDLKPRLNLILKKLLNNPNYKSGAYFKSRTNTKKDEVNGVIGVAWVIEGLCASYEILKDEKILSFLNVVVSSIKFDNNRMLWERPTHNINNKSGIDETFNHQLWLAYSFIYYSKVSNKNISNDVRNFFKNLENHLNIHKEGLIKHALENRLGLKNIFKTIIKKFIIFFRSVANNTTTKYKENGYHLFNMFAFARIKFLGHEDLFINSKKFKMSLSYSSSEKLFKELSSNKEETDFYKISTSSTLNYNRYGFPYNVSGFEFLYLNKIFKLNLEKISLNYIDCQLKTYGYNYNSKKFEKKMNTEDEINLLLRVYELSFYINNE